MTQLPVDWSAALMGPAGVRRDRGWRIGSGNAPSPGLFGLCDDVERRCISALRSAQPLKGLLVGRWIHGIHPPPIRGLLQWLRFAGSIGPRDAARTTVLNQPRRRCAEFALCALLGGCVDSPSIFHPAGVAAGSLATLGWGLTIISLAVVLVICALLLVAMFRRRSPADPAAGGLERTGPGVRWIVIGGVILPAAILTAAFVFSTVIQVGVANPPRQPAVTIQVIGHRWWWEVKYLDAGLNGAVITANEVHVPIGQPVRFNLASDDVIHSFWVPELAGKTDVIPGQTNTMWMEADRPGTYRGQCAEYCGLQHAHMAVIVVAEPPDQFQRWIANQRADASNPSDSVALRGLAVFRRSTCTACHAIRGSDAFGRIGPDLTHLASRRTIAAGTLENNRGNLAGWISNAQALKPGTGMPRMTLAARDLAPLVAYLESLK
jgi:cytochrome c oxidase subunit 2